MLIAWIYRGAGTSKGRTSWQSKSEQDDYLSFIGFIIYYLYHLSPPSPTLPLQPRFTQSDTELHDLSPVPSQTLPSSHNSDAELLSPMSSVCTPKLEMDGLQIPSAQSRLILAGYSYGAMIANSLPLSIDSIIQPFQTPQLGSAHAEIRMRADCIAGQQNELMNARVASLLSQTYRRGPSLQIEDHILSNPSTRKTGAGVRMGGEGYLRRASHESHRSRSSFTIETPERVRKSVDRVRSITKATLFPPGGASGHGPCASSPEKSGSDSEGSIEHIAAAERTKPDEKTIKAIPRVGDGLQTAYLLVSPLHGWVSTLATLWSSKSVREKELESNMKFMASPTLAVFGDNDVFVSVKRLRNWVEKLKSSKKDGDICQFRHREVSGAGHFWRDHDAIRVLQEEVRDFVASL